MGPPKRRTSSLPHPRATGLLARTIYRELRRARYDHQDMVRFVGDLMELVTSNIRKAPTEAAEPLEGVLDPETGLPNRATFEEVLDFEIQRADEASDGLLVLCIEVTVPEWFSDDLVRAVHERTADALQRPLRRGDVVARLPPDRYLVLVPAAGAGLVLELCARFGAALHGGTADRPTLPTGTGYSIRWIVREGLLAGHTGADLLGQCLRAPAIPLGVVEQDRPTSVTTDSLVPPPPKSRPRRPSRRVVLALGGGAVRAGVHVGVIDVLADAGVEIAGVAGTSAGALVGAMLLVGLGREDIVARFEAFTESSLYEKIRSLYVAYMRRANRTRSGNRYFRQSDLAFMSDSEVSAVPNELFADFIEYFVGPDRDISTLDRPFAVCATDIAAGRPALFVRGPLHQALRASCAVPGLFSPQADGDRLLVDGSTVTEVPIGAALGLHLPAPVLAVYLERPAQKVATFSTSTEVYTRAAACVQTELVREQLRAAPLLLTVPVRDGGWLDFRRAQEMRNVGEVVTRVALEGLLRDIDRASRS